MEPVSTGREGYNTPSGEFQITEKDREHVSSLYGDYVDRNGRVVMQNLESGKNPSPGEQSSGEQPYFLGINGGIGMHAGYLPGYPAGGTPWRCMRICAELRVESN